MQLQAGLADLVLVTCNRGREPRCIMEMRQLDSLILETTGSSSSVLSEANTNSTLPFKAQLSAELQTLTKKSKNRGLSSSSSMPQIALGKEIQCIVLMKSTISVIPWIDALFNVVLAAKLYNPRSCHRVIPIQRTCRATLSELVSTCSKLLTEELEKKTEACVSTFAVVFEGRMCQGSALDKNIVTRTLVQLFPRSKFSVDLENPHLVVMIQVIKGIAGVSILRHYQIRHRYNVSIT